ncbi:hypothetical protein EVAR_49590_1 [Eumeta japonica]|uniref:Uncharacterized protein n=1 Tax=Eumeta variegata TaxID=151549 RepID=A0A4C1ZVR5_EUMVA|nr:hypothetical protein EVAR_49590_1 [Eumeta japonica]
MVELEEHYSLGAFTARQNHQFGSLLPIDDRLKKFEYLPRQRKLGDVKVKKLDCAKFSFENVGSSRPISAARRAGPCAYAPTHS